MKDQMNKAVLNKQFFYPVVLFFFVRKCFSKANPNRCLPESHDPSIWIILLTSLFGLCGWFCFFSIDPNNYLFIKVPTVPWPFFEFIYNSIPIHILLPELQMQNSHAVSKNVSIFIYDSALNKFSFDINNL
jgi:hypothetical protein